MTVTLLEILAAARAHVAPLAAESAGYLLLGVADLVAAAPRAIAAEQVELCGDGSVRLRAGGDARGSSAERALRRLLGSALEVSSSVGPGLRRASERREDTGLEALVRELETALIPVNRSAARRALGRLHRETERARNAGRLKLTPPEPQEQATAPGPAPEPVLGSALPEAAPVAPQAEQDWDDLPIEVVLMAEASPAPPQAAVVEEVFTRPEPVVVRARARQASTPKLGTLITAQSGERDLERTDRAPPIDFGTEPSLAPPGLLVARVVEASEPSSAAEPDARPCPADAGESWPEAPASDPEPSLLPDVLTAMLELHTGVEADEAPTRLRDVQTQLISDDPAAAALSAAAFLTERAPPPDPESEPAPDVSCLPALAFLPEVAFRPEPSELLALAEAPLAEAPLAEALLAEAPLAEALLAEPVVDDEWQLVSSLDCVETAFRVHENELAEPALHDALTWSPAAVAERVPRTAAPLVAEGVVELAAELTPSPAYLSLVIGPVLEPEPSPLVPAVLPVQQSDVSELVDSFQVSEASSEQELRGALKNLAGLDLTPMPLAFVDER